jgi:hypothetical protein
MLRIKCPLCGSVAIDRINHQVKVYEQFRLKNQTDYAIGGGNEIPTHYMELISDEKNPPYIEELDSDDLEFICECGYKFEGIKTDQDMVDYADGYCLIVNCVE